MISISTFDIFSGTNENVLLGGHCVWRGVIGGGPGLLVAAGVISVGGSCAGYSGGWVAAVGQRLDAWLRHGAVDRYLCRIDHISHIAFSSQWAIIFISTITFWLIMFCFRCDAVVMGLDDFFHIFHATIANFDFISVENFVKFIVFIAEVLVDEFKKNFPYICLNIF